MTRAAARPRRQRGQASRIALGALTGLVFNASLIALPFMGAALWQTISSGNLIDYAPTPATRSATQRALKAEASRFARAGEDRRMTWNNLIARELGEGDIAAARGFALSAPAILRGGDSAQIQRQMPPNGGDRDYLVAAIPLIEPSYARQRFRSVIGTGESASFDVLGDAQETAAIAQRWRNGEAVDYVLFALGGATLGTPDSKPDDVRLGASVLKIAKNGARLSPEYASRLDAEVAAAVPPDRLRSELDSVFQNPDAVVDEGAAAALAFVRARESEAWRKLADDLRQIGAMARATSPSGAAQLLTHARTSRDLERLRLLADATGERAVAVAKRTPDRLILKSARGSIRWTDRLIADIGWTLLAALGFLISTHAAVFSAVRRKWDGGEDRRSEVLEAPAPAALSKAEAVKRARAGGGPKPSPSGKQNVKA
jgi:hypothetical protein